MNNAAQIFNNLAISLSILYNFDSPTKLFSDLYLVKFLDTSAKSFFFNFQKLRIYDFTEFIKKMKKMIYKGTVRFWYNMCKNENVSIYKFSHKIYITHIKNKYLKKLIQDLLET